MQDNIDRLALVLLRWFEREQWTIESDEQGHVVAVMGSGYGSGPVVINIRALATFLDEHSLGDGEPADW